MIGLIGPDSKPLKELLQAFYPLCVRGKVKSIARPGHLDGWGIAGYKNDRPVYFGRSSKGASTNSDAWEKAVDDAQVSCTPILLAHFRKASVGDASLQNTHPFRKGPWSFCHNGTLYQADRLPLKKYKPEGTTDSERLFLFLVEVAERFPKDQERALKEAITWVRLNLEYNSLTFLITDGKAFYAYRDYSSQRLEKGETVLERERYYTLWTTEFEGTRVVCSEPIMRESIPAWTALENGEFLSLSCFS